jgi:hypothetical protein
VHGVDLTLEVGGRAVHHVQQQVGLTDHLEGGTEGLDQLVGKLPHEAHRVGDQHGLTAREVQLAGAGVEGGEESVLDQHVRAAQAVEEGRLAGVGVADQRDRALPGPAPAPALGLAGPVQPAEVGLEAGHP